VDITEVRITLRDEGRLRAFASITFDNWFVVRGLKIIESTNGTFVAMPSRKRSNGEYQDIAHPISREAREWLENAVITAYEAEVERGPDSRDSGDRGGGNLRSAEAAEG
jgi:stage V sporulation protein G